MSGNDLVTDSRIRNMVKLSVWKPDTLPQEFLQRGCAFIRERFYDYWGIRRTDISEHLVANRYNLIAMEDRVLVGWLALENDGELVNGCVKRSYHGGILLARMILRMRHDFPDRELFAFVPIDRRATAGCLRAGMQVAEPPVTKQLDYPERHMLLVKLVMPHSRQRPAKLPISYMEQQFKRMLDIGRTDHGPSMTE